VLEHIRELNNTINKLYNIINDNGSIIIDVPDMAQCSPQELPFQEFSTEHINYFTIGSLSNIMSMHGLVCVKYKSNKATLTGVFKKGSVDDIKFDFDGCRFIEKYIEKSISYEQEIYRHIEKYKNVALILWGCGTFMQRLLSYNILQNIVVCVDSNKNFRGNLINGIKIISPDELKAYNQPILITTSLRYIDDIVDTIRNKLELNNEILKLHSTYKFEYVS
jgi:hypothetical protein